MDDFRLIKTEEKNVLEDYLNRNELECSDLYHRFLSQGIIRDQSNRNSGWFYGNYEDGILTGVFFFANNGILLCHFESDTILDRVVLLRALKHYKPKMIMGAEEYVSPIWEMLRKSLIDCRYIEAVFMSCNSVKNHENLKIEDISIIDSIENFDVNEVLSFLIEVEKAFGRKGTMLNKLKEKAIKRMSESGVVYIRCAGRVVAQGMVEFTTDGLAQIGGIYVTPESRRKGYAEIIVDILTKKAIENGKKAVLIVEKKNQSAVKLYNKMGYRPLYKYITLEMTYS